MSEPDDRAVPTGSATAFNDIFEYVGRGPIVRVPLPELPHVRLFAKLEGFNPTGSVKDRAAIYIISKCLANGTINKDTLIVESSSGNFGIALAAVCRSRGMRFRCIIDPRISATNEMLIRSLGAEVVKVTERDAAGGYLQTRIKTVREILQTESNAYWVNQYANPLNAEAYRDTLGEELCTAFPKLDYLFVGVSSGGTIAGLSQRVKRDSDHTKVVAADAAGSAIFGGPSKKRWIPGIGSSLVPDIVRQAKIDHVVMVEEVDAVHACHELLERYALFVGGSSGTVFAAVRSFFTQKQLAEPQTVVAVFADRGDRYVETVFNGGWCAKLKQGLLSLPPPPNSAPTTEGER